MAEARMAHPDLRHPFAGSKTARADKPTVIYNNKVFAVDTAPGLEGFWVSPGELQAITGFELKPEGACLGDLCIPIRAGDGVLSVEGDHSWLNLIAFADLLEQPHVADAETRTLSLGEMPVKRQSMLAGGMAPDFELLDRQGKVVRMADYKGKKALIITWSSW